MKQTKLILLLPILLFVISQGCSNKPQENNSDVIRVESSEIAFDDSVRRPYQEYIYDDNGYLKRTVAHQYGKDSLGKWKENALITCDYIRSGRTINIEGVREDKDLNTGISQKKDIKVKLECDVAGKIIKRTEQLEGYILLIIDEFEWEGDVIKKKKRHYDGFNGSYEDIVEYTYEDGNMVSATMKSLMIVKDTRSQTNGTIRCNYDTLHLSYQTYPDECYLVSSYGLEMFAVKHSRNETLSSEWNLSLLEMDMKNKRQVKYINSILSSTFDVQERSESGFPIAGGYLIKMGNKIISYVDSVPNSETQEEQRSVIYTKYKDMRKK